MAKKFHFIRYIKGSVQIEVRGKRIEEFVNQAVRRQLKLWNVQRIEQESVVFHIQLRDFFRLRPLLKQTSCRMHVLNREGMPFAMQRLEHRKLFILGMAIFVVGIIVLSQLVWKVEVTGNEQMSEEVILSAAQKIGIYEHQWKFRLEDPKRLSEELAKLLPDVTWVGISIHGTQVRIQLTEAKKPEKKELLNPRHIVAKYDAVITRMLTEQGRPMVAPNTRVKKGQVLISGILGQAEDSTLVVAKGKVTALVWHSVEIKVPTFQKRKVYTGEDKKRFYVVVGNRALQLTGYGKLDFAKFETISSRKTFKWREKVIPIGWINEELLEVKFEQMEISLEDAKQIGLEQARAELLAGNEEATIKEEKILHEQVEGGKVYMKVLFEVEEEIGVEQPLIPSIQPD